MSQKGHRVCYKVLGLAASHCLELSIADGMNVARVIVHFQSVAEKFTPHDTIFSFTSSAELKDSKLSSACSLHTASASVKSSTDSLRPPALSEIAEDAQESQSGCPDDRGSNHQKPSVPGEVSRARVPVSKYSDHPDIPPATSTRRTLSPAHSTRTIRNTDKELPPTPPEIDSRKGNVKSTHEGDRSDNRPNLDSRYSFQSSRPATRDNHSVYDYKPKIKLGPRPSTESATRSHTLDSPRPVSTLPSSVRIPARKAVPTRSQSQPHQKSDRDTNPSKIALSPPLPVMPTQILETSHPKSNCPPTPTRSIQPKSPAITPEKRRLMKALQLRQKQLAAQALKSNFGGELVSSEPKLGRSEATVETTAEVTEKKARLRNSEATTMSDGSEIVQVFIEDLTKSSFTNLDSSPISVIEPSDGQSTQASSITDEDVPQVELKIVAWGPSDQTNESGEELARPPSAENIVELDDSSIFASSYEISTTPLETFRPEAIPLPPADENETHELNSPRNSIRDEAETDSLRQLAPENHWAEPNMEHQPRRMEKDINVTRPSTGDTSYQGGLSDVLGVYGRTASLKRASTPENSEDHFLSDDSFMEELRSATVQEAKPMSVSLSKSPIAPSFPRRPSDQHFDDAERCVRSVSNPLQDVRKEDQTENFPLDLKHPTSRSFSASHSPVKLQPQQASAILLKKVGVSSGISQRIKALEQLSSRPSSPSSQGQSSVNAAGPSPAYVSLRKVSLKSPSLQTKSNESMGGKIHQKISSSTISSSFGPVHHHEKEKSSNVKVENKAKRSQPDSISVTATIIRDSRNKVPQAGPVDPNDPNVRDLCRSPLLVEHQSGRKSPTPPPLKPPRSRFASPRSISSSSTEHKGEPPHAARRDSLTSKQSVTSGRGSEADLSISVSDTSVNGVNGHDGSREERKESRKSRLFKRMSGISSASRRSIVQALNPSMKEGPIVEHHETVFEGPKTMAAFGDVNIQFPDTLVGNQSVAIRSWRGKE